MTKDKYQEQLDMSFKWKSTIQTQSCNTQHIYMDSLSHKDKSEEHIPGTVKNQEWSTKTRKNLVGVANLFEILEI